MIEFTSKVSAVDRWIPLNLSDVHQPFFLRWIWKWKMCHAVCSVGRFKSGASVSHVYWSAHADFVFLRGDSEAADKSRIMLSSIRLHFPSREHWNDKPDQVIISWNKDVFHKQQMKTNSKQTNQISAFMIIACWRQHSGLRIRQQAVDCATSWQFDPPPPPWSLGGSVTKCLSSLVLCLCGVNLDKQVYLLYKLNTSWNAWI